MFFHCLQKVVLGKVFFILRVWGTIRSNRKVEFRAGIVAVVGSQTGTFLKSGYFSKSEVQCDRNATRKVVTSG